jgi:drug/metabolite transporter (DMT)-like permease
VSFRKYLVLAATVIFASFGDICLSYGMKRVGPISAARWTQLIAALCNSWVVLGIVLLLGFLASYLSALSWSDLTYVLPATAFGYVLLGLLSVWLLGEKVTATRWIGIVLVSSGVAIVTRGPSVTDRHQPELEPTAAGDKR